MAADFTQTLARIAASSTTSTNDPVTLSLTVDATNKQWILDFHVTGSGATEKIYKRWIVKESFSPIGSAGVGTSGKTVTITEYIFTGSGTYVSSTNPANSTAINATNPNVYTIGAVQDYDAVLTAAGVARA